MKTILHFWISSALWIAVYAIPANAMSETELQQLYLDVLETSVDVFEPIWVDESARIPNSGFYDFRQYPDWMDDPYATIITISGNGMVQFCYAVLLMETDKPAFGQRQLSREVLLNRAIQSLRWCCLTSSYVENPYPYLPNTRADFADGPYWRRRLSWRADEVGWLTLAACILWDRLDADTQKQVEAVLTGGAAQERLVQTWYPPQGGNHDQIKQDLSSTMGAAYVLRHRPDSRMFWDILSGNGIDLVSTVHDRANPAIADGTPVSGWSRGWNLYPDYSSDHHGWCNLWYGSDLIFEGRSYIEILSALTGVPKPGTFTWPGNGFDGVLQWLKTIALPEGEPFSPHGNEYDAYYGAGLLGYCYGATWKKDPIAAALEEQAARLLQRHSGAVRKYDYHRNSWAKAAVAYLWHKWNGPRIEPLSWEEAMNQLQGAYRYRSLQHLVHRSPNKIASFAWGSISSLRNVSSSYGNGLCGFIFPSSTNREDPDPLIYCHPKSWIGDFQIADATGTPRDPVPPESIYTTRMDEGNLHTTGLIPDPALDRYYAFHSFDEGPSVLFTQFHANADLKLTWSGLPVYFYAREGFTNRRSLDSAQNTHWLDEETVHNQADWWSVDDRIGVLFAGGNPIFRTQRSVGYNWARKDSYKDKCDGVYISPLSEKTMTVGDRFSLSTVFYTNTLHAQLAALNRNGLSGVTTPQGWASLITGDPFHRGKRYFAITRFQGNDFQAVIDFSRFASNRQHSLFEEGAPVLSVGTQVQGNRGTAVYTLNALESAGEIIDMYVEAHKGKSLTAFKKGLGIYRFVSHEPNAISIRLRYRGKRDATLLPSARILASGSGNLNSKAILQKLLDASVDAADLRFKGTLTVDLGHRQEDRTAPAVDMESIAVREDKQVKIAVTANDRSGIQSVELYCDGQLAGRKNHPPYLWTHRPGIGYHTYYTVAADASENSNTRESFKQTVRVE